MTHPLAKIMTALGFALLSGCAATNEIHPMPAEWARALPGNSRLTITGVYNDASPDLIGTSTSYARLSSCFFSNPIYQKYDASKGPIVFVKIVENSESLEATMLNRDGLVMASRLLKKNADYLVDGLGINVSSTTDLRSGEGGSIVQVTYRMAKRTDGVLLVKTSEKSTGGVFEQWYRFVNTSAR